jgi:hypothetical protein
MEIMEGSGRGLIFKYYPGIRLEQLRKKTTRNLSQESRSPGRDLNPLLSENDAGVLHIRP